MMRYDGRFFAPVRINLIANKIVSPSIALFPPLRERVRVRALVTTTPPDLDHRPLPKEEKKTNAFSSSFSSSGATTRAIQLVEPASLDRRRLPFPKGRPFAASSFRAGRHR